MNVPKTLSEAKENLESAATRIAQLESLVQGHNVVLESFGIVAAVDEKGNTTFSSPRLIAAENEVAKLQDQIEDFKCKEVDAIASVAARDATIELKLKRISDLEAAATSVEARAREMLALRGGPPLNVDGADVAALTSNALRTQLQAEKDPVARGKIYKDLKAQEAKENKRN
jgi:hypothetical protein